MKKIKLNNYKYKFFNEKKPSYKIMAEEKKGDILTINKNDNEENSARRGISKKYF